MNIDTILFDMDDTLVNTRKTAEKRIIALLKIHNLPEEYGPLIYNLISHPNRSELLQRHYKFARTLFQDYEKLRTSIVVDPIGNFNQILNDLKYLGITAGILTNNTKEKTEYKLSKCGITSKKIEPFFYHSNNMNYLKPDPRCFNQVLKHVDRTTLSYVGDSKIDYFASRAAKIQFVGVLSGTTNKTDFLSEGVEESEILNDISEITNILVNLYE